MLRKQDIPVIPNQQISVLKFIVKVSFRNTSFFPSLFSFVSEQNYMLRSAAHLADACPKEKDEAIILAALQHRKYQPPAQFSPDLPVHVPWSQTSLWPDSLILNLQTTL